MKEILVTSTVLLIAGNVAFAHRQHVRQTSVYLFLFPSMAVSQDITPTTSFGGAR